MAAHDTFGSSSTNLDLLHHYTRMNGPLQWVADCTELDNATNIKLRNFLRDFQTDTFEVHTYLAGRKSQGTLGYCISELLSLLDSLVVVGESNPDSRRLTTFQGLYPGLQALDAHHASLTTESRNEEKAHFRLEVSDLRSQAKLVELMKSIREELQDDEPRSRGADLGPKATKSKRSQPNYELRKRSENFFNVLWTTCRCGRCSAPTTALALATHRKAVERLKVEAMISFKGPGATYQEVLFEFSTADSHNVGKSKVAWADRAPDLKSTRIKRSRNTPVPVAHICEVLEKARKKNIRPLLRADSEQLWMKGPQPRVHLDQELENMITLADLLPAISASERVKLIIAVILAHTLLHFQDTSWLHRWGRNNIVFIRSEDAIPLRPFLVSQPLSCTDEGDDDALYDMHPHSDILNFGIVLLELHQPQTVTPRLSALPMDSSNAALTMAKEFLQKFKQDMTENYFMAIEASLDESIDEDLDDIEDDEFTEEQIEELTERRRQIIYQRIVKPLEDELEDRYKTNIDGLDDTERDLDVANYGQLLVPNRQIRVNRSALSSPRLPPDDGYASGSDIEYQQFSRSTRPYTPQNTHSARPLLSAEQPSSQRRRSSPSGAERMEEIHRSISSPAVLSASALRLFDDHSSESYDESTIRHTETWFELFGEFQERLIESKSGCAPIKIAIVDSGIDLSHELLKRYKRSGSRVKDVRVWSDEHNGVQDRQSGDRVGHGTHIADLILSNAPKAELYIAKVTESGVVEGTSHIADAITYAADVWSVDIISLSFGFVQSNSGIKAAIRDATNRDIIVFAAAANDGGNRERAFPANFDPVICIHSSDGLGNPSKFNPTPKGHTDNFSILGEAVEAAGPGDSSIKRSGTSFATPIAVCVGALILGFVKARSEDEPELLEALKSYDGMKKVLRRMCGEQARQGYDYISPWTLLPRNDTEDLLRLLEETSR